MNKRKLILLFFAALAVLSVGCKKESDEETCVDPDPVESRDTSSVAEYMILYSFVDGGDPRHCLCSNANLQRELRHLLEITRNGHRVTMRLSILSQRDATKNKQVQTFDKEEDAVVWMEAMLRKGYTVVSEYDKTTGVYTLTASI